MRGNERVGGPALKLIEEMYRNRARSQAWRDWPKPWKLLPPEEKIPRWRFYWTYTVPGFGQGFCSHHSHHNLVVLLQNLRTNLGHKVDDYPIKIRASGDSTR